MNLISRLLTYLTLGAGSFVLGAELIYLAGYFIDFNLGLNFGFKLLALMLISPLVLIPLVVALLGFTVKMNLWKDRLVLAALSTATAGAVGGLFLMYVIKQDGGKGFSL